MAFILTTLLLAAHLAAMNIASGAPLLAAWMLGRRGGDAAAWAEGHRQARWSAGTLLAGAVLGGVLFLAPSPKLNAALARFPASAFWFAGAEVLFSLVCGLALMAIARGCQRRPVVGWLIAIASATNLLYHFPPLMIVIGKLAASPSWTTEPLIERQELVALALRPEVLALWIHYALAAIAVAAIAALWRGVDTDNSSVGPRLAGIALVATALQLPVGVWVLTTSPADLRASLLGENLLASAAFLAGLVATLKLLQSLAVAAFGDQSVDARRAPAMWTAVVVLAMTATLRGSEYGQRNDAERKTAAVVARRLTPARYSAAFSGSVIDASRSPAGSLPSAIKSP